MSVDLDQARASIAQRLGLGAAAELKTTREAAGAYRPNSPPLYVGIDPGTQCGWAVLAWSGERIASGCWNLSMRTGEGAGMRFLRLRTHLRELLAMTRPMAVAYELVRDHSQSVPGPGPGGRKRTYNTQAAHVYGGIVAMLGACCDELGVNYQPLEVGPIKKHATGKGNAGKPAMVAAALKRWDVDMLSGDNEADALWIADLLRTELELPF